MTEGLLGHLLTYSLLLAACVALVHAATVALRRPLAVVPFCAAAGLASIAAGWVSLGRELLAQVERWPVSGGAWVLGLSVGLFSVGAVLGLAWLGLVKGAARWADRLFRRAPPRA